MVTKTTFVDTIIEWWQENKRDYPWRKTRDPYRTLLTEILLRKTTATHVNSIYIEFFDKYPDIDALSKANIETLKKLITPLGLANQRSNQILKLVKTITGDLGGKIPTECDKLLELPGVGRYTAGAVMCVSYSKDEAMVDTNAVRVIGRYFDFKSKTKTPYTDPELWGFVKKLIPKGKCKEFNLGVIDFANAICLAKIPKCQKCPLKNQCNYFILINK